jgi:hypothetical protein
MRNAKKILLLLVGVMTVLLSSCSVSRHLPDDALLLDKVNVFSEEDPALAASLKSKVKQQPNSRFLGIIRLPLRVYSLAGVKDNAINRFLKNMGEAPRVYDEELAKASCGQLRRTLMNKGLEVIEAMRLYDLPLEKVDVLIHRQSIVHSLVELCDGAVMAQLGTPDMRLPIQLALTYPERINCPVDCLDLTTCAALTFTKPDMEAFPCLALARKCAKMGGTACAVMNGANEAAVALYLQDEIGFYDIYTLVSGAVDSVPFIKKPNLEQILESDRLAREYVHQAKHNLK